MILYHKYPALSNSHWAIALRLPFGRLLAAEIIPGGLRAPDLAGRVNLTSAADVHPAAIRDPVLFAARRRSFIIGFPRPADYIEAYKPGVVKGSGPKCGGAGAPPHGEPRLVLESRPGLCYNIKKYKNAGSWAA